MGNIIILYIFTITLRYTAIVIVDILSALLLFTWRFRLNIEQYKLQLIIDNKLMINYR